MKPVPSFIVTVLLSVAATVAPAGCGNESQETGSSASSASADRCPHDIKADRCPFCTPSLIESDGFCGEHGVAEALCYQCRPYLNAAFRAKGDWCAAHNAPDSQCVTCHPELLENRREGEHGTSNPGGSGT